MSQLATISVVSDLLNRSIPQLQKALPKVPGLSVERLVRVALTEFNKNPRLRECSPVSFCSAVMQAAQMGLEFGELKQCALVPYKDECKLMVQYQGWLALLWRSNSIKDVQARIVYEGDIFDIEYGSEIKFVHKPTFTTSVPLHYYASATPYRGNFMIELMTLKQVEAHMKQYARGLDKKDSPWNTAFDSMALKTVLRKLIKLLPLTADSPLLTAVHADERIWEADVQQARVEKWKSVAESTEPSDDEKIVAYKQYSDLLNVAQKHKVDLTDIPTTADRNDVTKLRAATDLIRARCESAALSQGQP